MFQDPWYHAIAATLVVFAVAPGVALGSHMPGAHHNASRSLLEKDVGDCVCRMSGDVISRSQLINLAPAGYDDTVQGYPVIPDLSNRTVGIDFVTARNMGWRLDYAVGYHGARSIRNEPGSIEGSEADVTICGRFGRVDEVSPDAEEAIRALQAGVAACLISNAQRDTGLLRQRRSASFADRAQCLVGDDERKLAAMCAGNDHEIKFQVLEVDGSRVGIGSEVNRGVAGAVGVYAVRSGAGMSDCRRTAPSERVPSGETAGSVEGCQHDGADATHSEERWRWRSSERPDKSAEAVPVAAR